MVIKWHGSRYWLNRVSYSLAIMFVMIFTAPIYAQSSSNPSGLEVPRYSSTRSKPINVRMGPGKKYEISWVYVKSAIPVEVIAEFDVWRKIKDHEGDEGWIHQSLISSSRYGQIKQIDDKIEFKQVALLDQADENSKPKAWLGLDYPLQILNCDKKWCEVRVKFSLNGAKEKTLSGYILQSNIWGVYENEIFD